MKKQVYIQPEIEVMNITLSSPVLVGSAGNINMGGGGGGGVDPD